MLRFLLFPSLLIHTLPLRVLVTARSAGNGYGDSSSSSSSCGSEYPWLPPAYPNMVAESLGKVYFGSATDNPEFNDTDYLEILGDRSTFGQITAGNAMKWYATEPSPGNFTFEAAELVANFAKSNGQLLRGHNCVWHSQLAPWVEKGNFTNATLTSILQNHCSTMLKHFKGDVYSWDVVNEPFNENGTHRDFVFTKVIGPSYIDIVMKAARAADPDTKLYINDYNIEKHGPKSSAMQTLVKDLQSRNIPIDGIGLQSHFVVGQTPTLEELVSNMEAFTSLGVEVAITELDIRIANLTEAMSTPTKWKMALEQQRKDYETVVEACMKVDDCVGITIWDYTDKYSWIPAVFKDQGAPCPWDANFRPKPALYGIMQGLLKGW